MKREDRKRKEVEFKKNLILDAAKKLFEQEGIENITIAQIAKEAGFAKGTFYLYYKSKDDIVSAIILEADKKFYKKVSDIVKKDIPILQKMMEFSGVYYESFVKVIDKYQMVEFFRSFKDITKIFSEDYIKELRESKEKFESLFIGLITEGQNEVVFNKNFDPGLLTVIIHSMMDGLLMKLSGIFEDCSPKITQNVIAARAEINKTLYIAFNFIAAGLTNKNFTCYQDFLDKLSIKK